MAVSVDSAADIERMRERVRTEHGVAPDYLFLSDPGHRVIDRYGLLNEDDGRGIPHPTTFVIDREGVVRWKFIELDYRVRPTNDMILEAVREVRDGGNDPERSG